MLSDRQKTFQLFRPFSLDLIQLPSLLQPLSDGLIADDITGELLELIPIRGESGMRQGLALEQGISAAFHS